MSDLGARLAGVEDRLAIGELLGRYCRTIDGDDAAPWIDCFTEDGSWISEGVRPFVLRGRAELEAWFAEFRVNVPLDTQTHLTTNAGITLAGDEAEAESTFTTMRLVAGEMALFSAGLYLDRLVRCDDGAWRIRERTSRASLRRSI